MDPVTQTNGNIQDANGTKGTSQTANSSVVIAGAFGGTVPNPLTPSISETMPAFSFDQDDFGETNNSPTSSTPHYENITDPFAGGITSTTSTTIASDATIIEDTVPTEDTNITIEEKLPEGTISLDSLAQTASEDNTTILENSNSTIEENKTTLPDQNTVQILKESPPVETPNPEALTEEITEKVNEEIKNEEISFDLPTDIGQQTNESTSFDLPAVETPITQNNTFTLPQQENTNNIQEAQVDTTTQDNQITIEETPLPVEEIEEKIIEPIVENTEKISEEPIQESIEQTVIEKNEDGLITSVSEQENKNDHELQDIYDEFQQSFQYYSNFKGDISINLVGLRTQEDEVTYTFTQTKQNIISIIKSNTTDILSFEQTESGLKVMLNNDPIGYYGMDKIDPDTTHFLKEKLGKFNIMLQSEYEREEKKQREGLKKIRESLRNF